MLLRVVRSLAGVVAGLLLISALAEGVEFALVTAINGTPAVDPAEYFAIRNLPWFLALKLAYNTAAAIAGGYLAALIAGAAEARQGLALAVFQTLAFAWALTQPEVSRWTPAWVWLALMILSFAGIVYGASLRTRRRRTG